MVNTHTYACVYTHREWNEQYMSVVWRTPVGHGPEPFAVGQSQSRM